MGKTSESLSPSEAVDYFSLRPIQTRFGAHSKITGCTIHSDEAITARSASDL
jgi:pyridoxine/pyridoxamine 5'-phosphate oxidase